MLANYKKYLFFLIFITTYNKFVYTNERLGLEHLSHLARAGLSYSLETVGKDLGLLPTETCLGQQLSAGARLCFYAVCLDKGAQYLRSIIASRQKPPEPRWWEKPNKVQKAPNIDWLNTLACVVEEEVCHAVLPQCMLLY
jgi:hypothetical protein